MNTDINVNKLHLYTCFCFYFPVIYSDSMLCALGFHFSFELVLVLIAIKHGTFDDL